MSKFLYSSDMHGRGRNSVNRLGSYFDDWLLKVDECIDIYKKNESTFWLIGGDLFDSNTVSNSVVDEFVDRIESNDVLVKVIFGNHDLVNCNIEMSKSTSLAHILRRSPNFELLETLTGNDCVIKGFNYQHNIEEDIVKTKMNFLKTDKFKIAVPHAFICLKKFPFATHILAEDIDTNADLVLCSHFHQDWGIETVNNTQYLNLGAFGRLSIAEHKHMPKVAVVNTSTRKIDIIQLTSAKKGKDIFDLAKYEENKANKKDISTFIESLNSVEWQSMSIRDQIEKISKEQKINRDVVDYLITQIGEIEQ